MSSGALAIGTNLTIAGPGGGQIAVSGNNASQVFNIAGSTTLSISGLTIDNGSAISGGGIYNDGTLTLTNDILSDNAATAASGSVDGGAVYNAGTLTVGNSTFTGNTVEGTGSSGSGSGNGGAIENFGTLTVTGSTFSSNSAIFVSAAANSAPSTTMARRTSAAAPSAATRPTKTAPLEALQVPAR